MGKWSQREYDQQLVDKMNAMFQKSIEELLYQHPRDTRFRTFIQQLDPNDKATQACFQSLVQQTMRINTRDSTRRRAEARRQRLGLPRRPPVMSSLSRPMLQYEASDSDADELEMHQERLEEDDEATATGHHNITVHLDPATDSSDARRRSFSPSFSPSRALAPRSSTSEAEPPSGPSAGTLRSPSQIWLEEYERMREDQGTSQSQLTTDSQRLPRLPRRSGSQSRPTLPYSRGERRRQAMLASRHAMRDRAEALFEAENDLGGLSQRPSRLHDSISAPSIGYQPTDEPPIGWAEGSSDYEDLLHGRYYLPDNFGIIPDGSPRRQPLPDLVEMEIERQANQPLWHDGGDTTQSAIFPDLGNVPGPYHGMLGMNQVSVDVLGHDEIFGLTEDGYITVERTREGRDGSQDHTII